MPIGGNGAITIPINLKMQELGDGLEQLKKGLKGLKVDSSSYKEYDKQIQAITRNLQKLEERAKQSFRTPVQANAFSNQLDALGIKVQNLAEKFKGTKFSEFSQDVFSPDQLRQLDELTEKLNQAKEAYDNFYESTFRKNIKSTSKITDIFKAKGLEKDLDTMSEREIQAQLNKWQSSNRTQRGTNMRAITTTTAEHEALEKQITQYGDLAQKAQDAAAAVQAAKDALADAQNELATATAKNQRVYKATYSQVVAPLDNKLNTAQGLLGAFSSTNRQSDANFGNWFGKNNQLTKKGRETFTQTLASTFGISGEELKAIGSANIKVVQEFLAKQIADLTKQREEAVAKISTSKAMTAAQGKVDAAQASLTAATDQQNEIARMQVEVQNLTAQRDNLQTRLGEAQQKQRALEEENRQLKEAREALQETMRDTNTVTANSQQAKNLQDQTNAYANYTKECAEANGAQRDFAAGADKLHNTLQQNKNALSEYSLQYNNLENAMSQAHGIKMAVNRWFGLHEVINLTKRAIRDAFSTIKELDSVMTQIAVVTDMTTADLWAQMPTYSAIANEYGTSIKGVYEVSQIYYQMGLQTNDVFALTTETLKMAKIAAIDYATAADYMTVAIRGFKMEMADAARVTDVYSALAASFAVDTQELAEAMSKTASGIASVGVSFESASAMITTITAATRESASVIGSSLKSLSARYGSIKTDPSALVDAEGQEISLNKIDKALKSIGVSIKDANGQLRDMDDVVLELGEKWNILNRNEQRFVATAFAGNLQSNRFLALVSNIDEYKKALEVANDSEGTGTLQFNKTLDNIETRLTKLKTAWQLFYTDSGIEEAIKWVITALTGILTKLNKLPKIGKFISASALAQVASIVNGIRALLNGIVQLIINAIDKLKEKAKRAAQEAGEEARRQAEATGQSIENATNPYDAKIAKGTKIANYMSMAGGVATIAGMAINNPTASSVVSGLGTTASLAGMGVQLGTFAGIPGQIIGGALGGVIGLFKLFSDLSTAAEREAEQKLEELKQAADEAENKRLESKQTVSGLEDYVKQYQEMAKAQYDSNDAKQQFLDLNAEIAEKYPDLLIQYDADGNRIIKLTELQKKLNEEKSKYREDVWDSAWANYDAAKAKYDTALSPISKEIKTQLKYIGGVNMTGEGGNLRYLQADILEEAYAKGTTQSTIMQQLLKDAESAQRAVDIFGQYAIDVYKNAVNNSKRLNSGTDQANSVKKTALNYARALEKMINSDEVIEARNNLKQQQKTSARSIMSSTFHYGDKTYDAYSPIYQAGKSAGFDMDQYIGNILGNLKEEEFEALKANKEEFAKRAQELAEGFQKAYLNNPEDAKFISEVQDKSQTEIRDFIQKDPVAWSNYVTYLQPTWEEIQNNLIEGVNALNEMIKEKLSNGGPENTWLNDYEDLASYVTTSNLSLWRAIVENDIDSFDMYYGMVATLAETGQYAIKDITNVVLQGDLSTFTGIEKLRQELTNQKIDPTVIDGLLDEARKAVKINPALEFAAMFDTYKKAYEELDKLASSLSTGLELKDAISWATKMGKSINEFTQKEGKFYVSQEQFWNYVNTQLPSIQQLTKDSEDFYDNLELDLSEEVFDITGKYGKDNLVGIQAEYERWRDKTDENGFEINGDKYFSDFIQEQKDKIGEEAGAAYKNLLESYAIQSIQAFGLITTDIRNKLIEQGLDDAQIKELEDKYLGSTTTSTLFSTGKIDIADIGKLPEVLKGIVDTETGKILNYKDALTKLRENIENGKLDAATYAPIYAEAVNSARSDLEDTLEGTLDGARASTERVAKLIENGVLVLNKKTGKYGYDLSSTTGYIQAMSDLYEQGYTTTQAIQKVTESALSQGTDVSKIQNPLFISEYQYQLSQARQEAVEGLQNAVFDTTKSFDISTLYKNNTTVSSKLNDLADKGAVRIEKDGEKVSLRILTTTIKNISSLIDTLAGGTDTSQNKASILATINSYLKSAQEGTLDREIAEWLLAQLPDGTQFKDVFELTAGGYRAKNIQDLRTKIAEQTTELNEGIALTVSQFQSQLEDYLSAGYTLEQAIKALGVKVGTVADIIKGNFSKNNKIAQYQRAIYSTYQGAMDNIYSAMIDGLSNPSGAEIDLTKARQLGGEAYDNLKEMITVVETETGEAFGYLMNANQSDILAVMRNLAIGGNSTVADKLAEFYNTIAQMITDGMNGDLSATNMEWLKKAFNLTDRAFIKTGTSFRLAEEGARRVAEQMYGIEKVAGNLTVEALAKSLQTADYRLQSVATVMKEIAKIQEEMEGKQGEEQKALEEKLATYQEILKINRQNASSFNIMSTPLGQGTENISAAYQGLAQARKLIADMNASYDEYGTHVIQFEDAVRFLEVGGDRIAQSVGSWDKALKLFYEGTVDTLNGQTVINMDAAAAKLGMSFDELSTAFSEGSEETVKSIAQGEVETLDAQIRMLEGIVALEELTPDEDGKINLDSWIEYDEKGNQIGDKAKKIAEVLQNVKDLLGEDFTIGQYVDENGKTITVTFDRLIQELNEGTDSFTTFINKLTPQHQEEIKNLFEGIDFKTVITGDENTDGYETMVAYFRKKYGIKDDNTIDIGGGKSITPIATVESEPKISYTTGKPLSPQARGIRGTSAGAKITAWEDKYGSLHPEELGGKKPEAPKTGIKFNQDETASVNVNIKFDGITYTIEGFDSTFSTKEEALAAIAEKYSIETQALEEKTAEITIPENATLRIDIITTSTQYYHDWSMTDTKEKAKDYFSKQYGLEDTVLPEKTARISQDIIVDFVATLYDKDGNPMPNVLDTGLDIKVVPQLDDFAAKITQAILEETYEVVLAPVIGNKTALQDAIQEAINARTEYIVSLTPQFSNPNFSNGQTIQSFRGGSGSGSSSSSKKGRGSSSGADVASTSIANIIKSSGLGATINGLSQNLNDTRTSAIAFGASLKGIIPSSIANSASSARYSLSNLSSSVTQISNDLTQIFAKIRQLVDELKERSGAAKGNVALAKGSNDALATGTLMGELGPELWVSGGHYYIAGQSGAEFVNLPDDAIVFNHLQTRSLLANGNTTRGRAIGGEDRAVAFATGSPEGPARASAKDTLDALRRLRAQWQSLLNLPASDLSKKAGGGGGGGGGAEDYKTFTADLERWYNLLRQIANYEQKITYEQKQRENFKHGQEYVDSLEKELKYLEKQADAYAVLSELQKSYYDQRRKDLNDTQYGKLIFTYTEDGLMQYLDDVVDANGNRQSRGLAILAELNRQSNEKGQSYWDKEGKNLYTGSFKVNGKQTIKGSSGGAAAQLMYLKSVGFDLNELLYNSEGGSNIGKNASETATNMMQTFFDNVDGWMEELDSLYDSYHEYLENIEDNTAAQQKILQEYIDNQMSVEDKLLKAITDRQQKIIDTLKDQIDIIQEAGQEYTQGLSEALSKERNLYNENKDDAELASKMRRLGILKRTGASASEIKALQNEIDNQLQENYFDAQQKQIDAIQEAIDTQLETLNQQLDVMEEALNYQKENGLLWAEVYDMMTKWTPEAMLNFIETYTSSYRENSQQKNSEDSKETLKQLEIWAASRGFDFSREPHKGNSKDYTKPNTSNDVAAPDMPRPSGGATTGSGTSGSGTSTMANGLAAPQEIDVENTGVYEDRTLTPTVRQVSKSDVIDIYKVGGYYTKKDGTHGKYAWEVNGKLPAGKYYDFNGEIYRNPGAKHRRIIYSATSGKVYYVYDKTYLPNAKKISSYSSGGMNYSTGMAMLHGTSSKPEAILNASDTKLFREKLFGNGDFSLRQAIATIDLLRDQIASTTNNNSSVDFNGVTINISSDVIANDYDAQRAGRNIFDEMIKMSRKSTMLGVSRR